MLSEKKKIIVVDDDDVFCMVLKKSLTRRGYNVVTANQLKQAVDLASQCMPDYAVIDLRIGSDSGLALLQTFRVRLPSIKSVMLTGYASITTAVEAIKLGAVHYLTKPANPDEIISAFFMMSGNESAEIPVKPLSVNRLEWEHINKVIAQNNGNISAAARALGMHRRSLQRKLQKYPAKE